MARSFVALVGGPAALATLLASSSASAAITITQTADPAPTYATTLTFDEPGTPTGPVASNAFASYGMSSVIAGDGAAIVDNFTANLPWVGSGNAMYGPYGIFANFSSDLTGFSSQVWDTSGPATPFGGGLSIYVFHQGELLASGSYTPAWGGVGKSWFNISTTDGSVFDEVRILGNGFFPETFADNMSWSAVPTPGAIAVLGLAFGRGSRRRSAR